MIIFQLICFEIILASRVVQEEGDAPKDQKAGPWFLHPQPWEWSGQKRFRIDMGATTIGWDITATTLVIEAADSWYCGRKLESNMFLRLAFVRLHEWGDYRVQWSPCQSCFRQGPS